MTLSLQSVSDGGLQIKVKADEPKSNKAFTMEQGTLTSYGNYLETSYENAISNLTHLQAELANDISGQQKFYFPASGTFFFKNPIMNHDGALICGIGYNGSDDFRNKNETIERITVQPVPDSAKPQQPGAIVGEAKNPDPSGDKDKPNRQSEEMNSSLDRQLSS